MQIRNKNKLFRLIYIQYKFWYFHCTNFDCWCRVIFFFIFSHFTNGERIHLVGSKQKVNLLQMKWKILHLCCCTTSIDNKIKLLSWKPDTDSFILNIWFIYLFICIWYFLLFLLLFYFSFEHVWQLASWSQSIAIYNDNKLISSFYFILFYTQKKSFLLIKYNTINMLHQQPV